MLIVPRSRDDFESISLNALAFAGHFLVGNEAEFQLLKERGPVQALTSVSYAA